MSWFVDYAARADLTDNLKLHADHLQLLAAGAMGEAGGISAELKKEARERDAYPVYRHKLTEELGDLLWYFARLVVVLEPGLTSQLEEPKPVDPGERPTLTLALELGEELGRLCGVLSSPENSDQIATVAALNKIWRLIWSISKSTGLELEHVSRQNLAKVESRWPRARVFAPLFDDSFNDEEQLPRKLEIEFRERAGGSRPNVILRCNGINFGDRLTDNIEDSDGYRYHDVFHFAYAVYLGWSPVIRALLRCKRKSNGAKDEGQDGARAGILEEAVSAIVFSRAKHLNFFDGVDRVDYDLLKTATEFVRGYEVDKIPLWQWEVAILTGFKLFRQLRDNRGGTVRLDLLQRQLIYRAPAV